MHLLNTISHSRSITLYHVRAQFSTIALVSVLHDDQITSLYRSSESTDRGFKSTRLSCGWKIRVNGGWKSGGDDDILKDEGIDDAKIDSCLYRKPLERSRRTRTLACLVCCTTQKKNWKTPKVGRLLLASGSGYLSIRHFVVKVPSASLKHQAFLDALKNQLPREVNAFALSGS